MKLILFITLFYSSLFCCYGQWEIIDTSANSSYNDLEIISESKVLFFGDVEGKSGVIHYNPINELLDTVIISNSGQITHSFLINDTTLLALHNLSDVYISKDSGFTFNLIGGFPLIGGSTFDFHFINDTIGFFTWCDNGNGSYKSVDGGETWSQIYDSTLFFNSVNLGGCGVDNLNSSVYKVSGTVFLQSTNYGVNWIEQSTNTVNRSYKNIDVNEFDGSLFLCGIGFQGSPNFNYGTIAKSVDYGNTWTIIDIPEARWLNDIEMASATVGYTVGPFINSGSGVIYKTIDSGNSWFSQNFSNFSNFYVSPKCIKCRGEDTCYVVGSYGLIAKTNNGGVGIDEFASIKHSSIYPNPAKGHISVSFSKEFLNVNYTIHSLQGHLVGTGSLNGDIIIENLRNGAYILTISNGEFIETHKFIKM